MIVEKINNPWSSVRKWEEFLYFCCPECNEKNQSKDVFIKHALNIHPMAKLCLQSIKPEVELKETYKIHQEISDFKEDSNKENDISEEKLTILIDQDPLVIVKNEVVELSESEEIDNFDSIKNEDNILVDESAQQYKMINLAQYDEENYSDTKDTSETIMKKQD